MKRTVQSSDAEAMIQSLNGFHFKSKIWPECPITLLHWKSMRPVCEIGMTTNA